MKLSSLATLIMHYNFEYNLNLEIISYGIDDEFINCGKREEIKKELGIDIDSIINKI